MRSAYLATWLLVAITVAEVAAQTESSDFSRIGFASFLTTVVSDYQSAGVNPANLGFIPQEEIYMLSEPLKPGKAVRKRQLAFSIAEGGFALHSDALNRQGLTDLITQTSSGSFTDADQIRVARDFADRGLRFSVDMLVAGISYQDTWGGLAATWRERISGTFVFNEAASRVAFQGRRFDYFDSLAVNFNGDTVAYAKNPKRFSELFAGTELSTVWFREFGLSYGVQVLRIGEVRAHVGAGVKLLQGFAYLDARVDNGQLRAQSSITPAFGIDYGKATSPSFIPGNAFVPVGDGIGVDVGITVTSPGFSFAVSVIDIGAIQWNGNVFTARDTILNGLTSTGFRSFNFFNEAQGVTGEGNFFSWDGLASATTALPTRLRLGTSYRYNSRLTFGADAVFPVNTVAGSLGEPLVSAGLDWFPAPWMKLGMGLGTGGNMGFFAPASIMFSVLDNHWELGVSSRDLITFVISDRPIVSAVLGTMRWRF